MPLLQGIFRTPSIGIAVDRIEPVPIHVSGGSLVCLPRLPGPSRFRGVQAVVILIRHIEIAREVAVIVRTGIRSVIPVKCCVSVFTGPEKKGAGESEFFRWGVVVFEEGDRLVGYPVASVADLTVLISPVGVVHVVTHKVVNLLGGSVLGSSLTGSSEGDQSKAMDVAPVLLHTEIISERTIVNTLYPIVSSKTGGSAHSVRPTFIILGNSPGTHQTKAVEGAVGEDAEPIAWTDLSRGRIDIGESVIASYTVRGYLRSDSGGFRPGDFVETTPKGIRGITSQGIVHLHSGDVHVLGLAGIAAGLETDSAEVVTCLVVEHVILVIKDRWGVLIPITVQVELAE